MREDLWQIVRRLDSDFRPYGNAKREGMDCSCGCRHFVKLAGAEDEWGVCINQESPRVGLLTFGHQGCSAFGEILLEATLTDAQLRSLIIQASDVLKQRRQDQMESIEPDLDQLPGQNNQLLYYVRTSYSPQVKGHYPQIFRIERYEQGFVAVRLEASTGGQQRPQVQGRFPAKNGEVFKIVRENGDFSYQLPFDGKIYNLKQYVRLSDVGVANLELLRPFFECVEIEVFEKIKMYAEQTISHAQRSLWSSTDCLSRWRNRDFQPDEIPVSHAEYRQMLRSVEEDIKRFQNIITHAIAHVEWLMGIDRSRPTLQNIPCPAPVGADVIKIKKSQICKR